MPAITITDLNNAKLDVDHIADLATSTALTATDRLGHVKRTMAGALDEYPNAFANASASEASRIASGISANLSAIAKTTAESARDAALIQAGVYATEALGRAAVADGAAFKVQGSGEVAAYEYRRTTSTTSVLIATYPSKAYVDSLAVQKATSIAFPDYFYHAYGAEANIYFNNICPQQKDEFNWLAQCSLGAGKQQVERFTIPTTTDTGGGMYTLALSAIDPITFDVRSLANTIVIGSSAADGAGENVKCLFIGDSFTAYENYTNELVALFAADAMDATLIGTRGPAGAKHEGISGWSVAKFYSDPASPFVFGGSFDYTQYITTNTLLTPDMVFLFLGINDVFGNPESYVRTVAAEAIIKYRAMISSIQAFSVSTKVCIALPTPSGNQDGFGADYGTLYYGHANFRRAIAIWNAAMIAEFSGQKHLGIYLVPTHCNLDGVNNMPTVSVAVNARNATTTTRQSNSVHPAPSGFYQIADSFFSFIKAVGSSRQYALESGDVLIQESGELLYINF